MPIRYSYLVGSFIRYWPVLIVLKVILSLLLNSTIRQQLTSTEDIRRVRKKAPCTRPEISMIQKQYLDDDNFFLEPLFTGDIPIPMRIHYLIYQDCFFCLLVHCLVHFGFYSGLVTCSRGVLALCLLYPLLERNLISCCYFIFFPVGMSIELISLHNQKCDLRGITVYKNELTGTSPEIDADLRQPSENLPSTNENDVSFETMAGPILSYNDVQDGGSLRSSNEAHLTSQTFENIENLDAGGDKNSEIPNVVEQSELTISNPLLLDRESEMAKFRESPLLSNNRMNEVDEINVEIDIHEENMKHNSDLEGDRSEQEHLPDVTRAETGDNNNDASGPSTTVVQITETSETNTSLYPDALSCLPDQEKNAPSVELDYAVMDFGRNEQMAKDGDINDVFETEPLVRDDVLSDRAQESGGFDLLSNSKPAELGYDEHIRNVLRENLFGSEYPVQEGLQGDGFMGNVGSPIQGEAYQRYMMGADGSYFDLHGEEVS